MFICLSFQQTGYSGFSCWLLRMVQKIRHARLLLCNGCSGSIWDGSTNVIFHSFFDVYLSLVPLPLLWLFILCLLCWIIILCLSLKYWTLWYWEQIIERSKAALLIGWAVSPYTEWFMGSQPTFRYLPDHFAWWALFACPSLQKAPVKMLFCSLKGVSLAPVSMSAQTEFQASSLSQWREKRCWDVRGEWRKHWRKN